MWDIKDAPSYKFIQLDDALKTYKKQKDIVVAIIDTGIDASHPLFKNTLGESYGVDFTTPLTNTKPTDSHGHGTHIAGIIKTIAPEAKLMILKYYNPKASGFENLKSTIKALRYAVSQNVDIINYSGGGPEASQEELDLLKEAQSKGILIVAAAGNESSDIDDQNKKNQQYFPANYDLSNIITVNSHNIEKEVIKSSNWGIKSVDIAAPGYQVKSAFYGNKFALMTGTSQATAFVTGVAALIKSQYSEFGYEQIKEAIIASATKDPHFSGKNLAGGYLNAVNSLKQSKIISEQLKLVSRSVAKK